MYFIEIPTPLLVMAATAAIYVTLGRALLCVAKMDDITQMRVFAFLNLCHPPTAWAVMRGMLVSARSNVDWSPGFISFMLAGIIRTQNNRRLYNETAWEIRRRSHHYGRKSRLEGLYFFETKESALRASDKWGGHFTEQNLYELEYTKYGEITRVDSDWITQVELDQNGLINSQAIQEIDLYWNGRGKTDNPLWELIGDGFAIVLQQAARQRAYEVVQNAFPESWIAIEMARIACEVDCSPAGQISPRLLRESENKMSLSYVLRDAEYHDAALVQRMATHPDFGRLANRWREADAIVIPGFQPWMIKFSVGQQWIPMFNMAIQTIHHNND